MEPTANDLPEQASDLPRKNSFLGVGQGSNSKESIPESPSTPKIVLHKEDYIWQKNDIVHTFVDELIEHNMVKDAPDDEDPPRGFRPFTTESFQKLEEREADLKKKEEENKSKPKEGKLVDGELIFNDEDDDSHIERDPALAEGNKLPDYLGEFPSQLLGRPLEELDKYIKHKTFVVVNTRIRKKSIFRFSATKSLFCLAPWNPFRRLMIYLATNQWLDYFITLTILVNLVFLSIPEEDNVNIDPAQKEIDKIPEYVFLVIYTLELIIKVAARGFILNKFTYLRDGWNWLDFTVVLISYITEILDRILGSAPGLAGIRAFRVFRALKAVSVFPGLKTIISALLKSFRMLAEVMLLTVFCMAIFALLALQVYMGALRQKCVKDPWPLFVNDTPHLHTLYSEWIENSSHWLLNVDDSYIVCGNASGSLLCPLNYTCLQVGENPNGGYTSYDHFGWAMLSICQLVTLDFWEDQYNKIIFASGPWNILFFMMVVFFGSFYLVNLMLAVVAMSYDEEADNTDKTEEADKIDEQLADKTDEISLSESDHQSKHDSDNDVEREKEKNANSSKKSAVFKYDAATLKLQVLEKQKAKEMKKKEKKAPSDGEEKNSADLHISDANNINKSHVSLISARGDNSDITNNAGICHRGSKVSLQRRDTQDSELQVTDLDGKGEADSLDEEADRVTDLESKERSHGTMSPTLTSKTQISLVSASGVQVDTDSQGEPVYEDGFVDEENQENQNTEKNQKEIDKTPDKGPALIIAQELDDKGEPIEYPRDGSTLVDRNCRPGCMTCCKPRIRFENWLRFQNKLFVIATHSAFETLVTACIALNTLSMTVEHYGMDQGLKDALEYLNYVFTSVFIFECVIKIMSMSKFYFKSGWNIFDFIVVLASIVEFGVSNLPGFSAIRTLRLLRILKLARSWPTMRLLISIVSSTLGSLTNLTLVLVLVLYIFAILGMQLFGPEYRKKDPNPRWHFKDAGHSFMMVFRVLCGEWIEPLWDCMKVANEGCIPLFLVTLVLGNYMVLNLFLAMLLNSFGSDTLRQDDKSDEKKESKVKLLLAKIRLACSCGRCCRKQRAISPSVHDMKMSSRTSLTYSNNSYTETQEKEAADIEAYGEKTSINADRTPAVKFTISNWNENETRTTDGLISNGLELQPVNSNGEVATEQKPANGILKSTKMIDQAFTTQRDQFAKFDSAMKASENSASPFASRSKVSTDEEVSNMKKPVVIVTTDDDVQIKEEDEITDNNNESNKEALNEDQDDEENMNVVLHDCCPKCCYSPSCWRNYEGSNFEMKFTPFRAWLLQIVESKGFEGVVLVLIVLSSLSLCFEDIYYDDYPEAFRTYMIISNYAFTILFTIEMVLKWISQGFKVYFNNGWSVLDFLIVMISLFSLVAESLGVDSAFFRALRAFRALRPLRVISRYQGMKVVVNALLYAIPSIVNVILVCLVFWLIFSIMGVQVFGGKFFKCVDGDGERLNHTLVPNRTVCEANQNVTGYRWQNSKINFDHVFAGYLALFQIATFEGWMEIMDDATDIREQVDAQPYRGASEGWYFYFVVFIIFGTFFTLNLFIGVIIDNFNTLKKQYDGTALDIFLTSSQKNYYNTMKKLGNKKPQKTIRRPKNKFQGFFFDIAVSSKFEIFIVICILINMILMAVEHYKEPAEVTVVLEYINLAFTAIFTIEAIIKIIGLRWHYFRRPWNVFDFIVVLLSLIGVILADLLTNVFITPTLLRVVRVFRIGRVLRLIKAAKGIRKLLFALLISLPALVNVASLLVLIMFIFSVMGMQLFGRLKHDGVFFNDIVNFETFPNSMVLLFRVATAAGWNEVLGPMLLFPPDCDSTYITLKNGTKIASENGDCGSWVAVPYLTVYILITYMIIINMYIAIILENFNQAHEQEEIGITEDDFEMFYVVWERFDPHATQFIKYEQLSSFVHELDDPLGIPKPNEIALVAFNLPIVEGDKLHCLDILVSLIKRVLGEVEESDEFKELKSQMEEKFRDAFPTRVNTVVKSTTMQRKKEDVAAKTLQRSWRRHKIQKNMKQISEMALELSRSKNQVDLKRRLSDAMGSIGSHNGSAISVRSNASHAARSPAGNTLTVPGINSHRSSAASLSDASPV